jgi:hypothetical protein
MEFARNIDADWRYFPANKMIGWLFFRFVQAGWRVTARSPEIPMQ